MWVFGEVSLVDARSRSCSRAVGVVCLMCSGLFKSIGRILTFHRSFRSGAPREGGDLEGRGERRVHLVQGDTTHNSNTNTRLSATGLPSSQTSATLALLSLLADDDTATPTTALATLQLAPKRNSSLYYYCYSTPSDSLLLPSTLSPSRSPCTASASC